MTSAKVSTFQERIAQIIDASGLTASKVAADLGLAKQTASAWKTGQNSPKRPTVYAISYYFGVSVEWLLGFDVPRERLTQAELCTEEKRLVPTYRDAEEAAKRYALEMLESHPLPRP